MTISTTRDHNTYIGNGSADTFNYEFKIFNSSDLRVVEFDEDGNQSQFVFGDDYSVTGVGDNAGTVVLSTPLANNHTLVIRRIRLLTQQTSLKNNAPYFAEIHEDAFDHLVMIAQQHQHEINRSIKLPENEEDGLNLPSAQDRANKILAFDEDGKLELIDKNA